MALDSVATAKLLGFVSLDILKAVDDAADEPDEPGAFARGAPPLKCAVRNVPASGELGLGKVPDCHLNLLRRFANDCGAEDGKPQGRSREDGREINWEMAKKAGTINKKAATGGGLPLEYWRSDQISIQQYPSAYLMKRRQLPVSPNALGKLFTFVPYPASSRTAAVRSRGELFQYAVNS